MASVIRGLRSRLAAQLIRRYLKQRSVTFDGLPAFHGPWPSIVNKGRIVIGPGCVFRSFRLRQTITVTKDAVLDIGPDPFFNDGLNVYATQSIVIGRHADVGDMVYIYDTDSHPVSPQFPVKTLPVNIGNHVWIGTGSIILPGPALATTP